jgi:DNA mismatch endonuclease (patch repair protein)
MARMPTRSTKPEVLVRRELHRRGLRYRINHRGLPGRPDVALTRARIVVFVDGCFWHMCPEHCRIPRANRWWWADKLARNRLRDREQDAALRALGWRVMRFWEHEDPAGAADAVEAMWRAAR